MKERQQQTKWAKQVTNYLCIKYVYQRFSEVRDAYHLAVAKTNAVVRIARVWRRYRAQLYAENKVEQCKAFKNPHGKKINELEIGEMVTD